MNERDKAPDARVARILVIEDDRNLQTVLSRVAKGLSRKLQITWMTSADEARQRLDDPAFVVANPFDLIVSDILLPGELDGVDLWKICQRHYPGAAFLLMSGLPIEHYLERIGPRVKAPSYLPKPFSMPEFRQRVLMLLEETAPLEAGALPRAA